MKNILILVKGEDETERILGWRFERKMPVIWITFSNGKAYPYNTQDVQFIKYPKNIHIENQLVTIDDVPAPGVVVVQRFGEYTRVYYKSGKSYLTASRSVRVIRSALDHPKSKHCFDYLTQIAYQVGVKGPNGNNILGERYSKIDFIREDSILSSFLRGRLKGNKEGKVKTAVFPFGFNISQKEAVDNGLNHKISVIEGPPGTGKTQTILNIIANAVMRGESVAVVSSNNAATANVYEKLQKNGVAFIAAPLGNSMNKEAFIENQSGILPDMSAWRLNSFAYARLERKLHAKAAKMDKMLRLKNESSALHRDLETVKCEYAHYQDYFESYADSSFPDFLHCTAEKALAFAAEYELTCPQEAELSRIRKFLWKMKYGIKEYEFLQFSTEEVSSYCQQEYYKQRILKLEKRICKLDRILSAYDFDSEIKEYAEMSSLIFYAKLADKYVRVRSRKQYRLQDLWRDSENFIKDYPVVLSTTYSLRASLSAQFVYDYVIVDEASQVDIATGALAMSCAKKMVIVGDLKQLPNVVDSYQERETNHIFEQYTLKEAYRYATHSLLSSVIELFPAVPRVLLKEHYRCHPEIIGFCNQKFYNNELIILTKARTEKTPMMVYRTVPGNHARGHVNQRQIDVILNEVFPQQGLDVNDESVGIVTPYRDQANALQKVFANTGVKADTADKFQGQERSTIILSTVDNQITDFTADPNRLNVAVSRAIDQFIVVTDGNEADKTTGIQELIGYIRYNNHEVIDSRIYSVFDCLYQNYSDVRQKAMRKYGQVSEMESENLMYRIIRDVLQDSSFSGYDVAMHVPLRMVLRDLKLLSAEEMSYATNHLTHLDFLIFSRLTHQPVLVIEVDGYAFHQNNEKQQVRDRKKEEVLRKYGIPLLRLNTTGSGEKAKLTEMLQSISS